MEKKSLKSTIMILLFTVVASVGATFAWYNVNEKINIKSTNNFNITVGRSLQISILDDGVWSTPGKEISVNETSKMMDITGDGVSFREPSSLDKFDSPVSLIEINDGENEGKYIERYVKISSTSSGNLYLSKESYVLPVGYDDTTGTDTTNLNAYNLSNNYIAAASRVSICEVADDDSETLKTIWIPNYQHRLEKYNEGGYDKYRMYTTDTSILPEKYSYLKSDKTRFEYPNEAYFNKFLSYGKLADIENGYANNARKLCTFTTDGQAETKTLVVRIWFEGTDNEANSIFNLGEVKYNISFTVISKEEETAAELSKLTDLTVQITNGNQCNGKLYHYNGSSYSPISEEEKYIYSYDGRTWKDYTSTSSLSSYWYMANDVRGEMEVYIKLKETRYKENNVTYKLNTKDKSSGSGIVSDYNG